MKRLAIAMAALCACESQPPTRRVHPVDAARPAIAIDAARPDAAPAVPASWTAGDGTRAGVVVIERPRYEKSAGTTRVVLETSAATRQHDLDGQWSILGYAPALHAYLLGGEFERGAWLPLDDLQYLDERTGDLRPSKWNATDWLAFAAVPSPTLRYLALVGQADGEGPIQVYVLDVASEQLAAVGKPPAPPPTTFQCDEPRAHVWGDEADGLVEMDPDVIVFSTDEQRITLRYGKDTCAARAPKRTELERKLAALRFTAPP